MQHIQKFRYKNILMTVCGKTFECNLHLRLNNMMQNFMLANIDINKRNDDPIWHFNNTI